MFDDATLNQLAHSIKQDGLMQPVIVRKADGDGLYELVAGERRWRAAQIAGVAAIPAIVKVLDDRQIAEWAVIENLQREDLNPMEQAEAFAKLNHQFNLTHEQIAERISTDRSSVTNLIRLLDLPTEIQDYIRTQQLSLGHGKVLLGFCLDREGDFATAFARRAVAGGWSVRMLESALRRVSGKQGGQRSKAQAKAAHIEDLEKQIATQLHTKVKIKTARKKNAGTLMIDYYDLDQFDDLMRKLGVSVE